MILVMLILIVAVIAACLVAVVGIMLAFHALRIRALYAIPAHPLLVPTSAEQIPPDLAEFLARVVPALHALAFETVASVHAPQIMATATWTQVLFIRRDRGDRASVMLLRPFALATPSGFVPAPPVLVFATELPDGRSVKTSTPPATAPPTGVTDVPALYDMHRADVDKTLGPDARGDVPAAGEEIFWLQARAGLIAEALAEACRFIPARDAPVYRPPWPLALRVAWRAVWSYTPRARIVGFDVSPPAPAPAPVRR